MDSFKYVTLNWMLSVNFYEMNCLSPTALHTTLVGGKKAKWFPGKEKKKKIIMMRSSRAWGGLRRCSKGAWWGVEGGACVELRGKPKGRGVVIWQSYLSIKQANLPSVAALVFRSVAYTDPVALICDQVPFVALNLISTAWKRVEVTLGYGDESQHVIWRSD